MTFGKTTCGFQNVQLYTILHRTQMPKSNMEPGEKILWMDGKMEGNGIQPNSQPIIG
jgi:hypothetical protein